MSIVQKLTEGIVNRDMAKEGQALLNKWSSTGLLEGLQSENDKQNMARLLENQAKELLREASTMEGGNVEGFAAVAFPIVRRVFAGLIANDLVSVQPMSLPSGLIFFLDFTFSNEGRGSQAGATKDESIYGQGVVGSQITGGVLLNRADNNQQPYGFASAFSSATGSIAFQTGSTGFISHYLNGTAVTAADVNGTTVLSTVLAGTNGNQIKKLLQWDVDALEDTTGFYHIASFPYSDLGAHAVEGDQNWSPEMLAQIKVNPKAGKQVRRLSSIQTVNSVKSVVLITRHGSAMTAKEYDNTSAKTGITGTAPVVDQLGNVGSNTPGALVGGQYWPLENEESLPEIDIKVDSIPITAATKKLKAKWTPELGQDLNAYHNLDAEVELTSILSEQIALEIDREILQDLVRGSTAATYYWARSPGLFVNRETGAEIGASSAAPDFTGTVSEWYETLIETINDVSAQIHRKTLRGGANFVVCGPETANILEFTSGFRANVTADADKGEIGAVKAGSLNRKFDVIVDPYFPRNAILVGRKGSSFLESGYVYAPYVPLQTTPTIFGPEDFVPRKGVMTRYGKKMVRPDMYGLVLIRGMMGEAGATS